MITNKAVDNMVRCESYNCSHYFYQMPERKYRYCPECSRKDMC